MPLTTAQNVQAKKYLIYLKDQAGIELDENRFIQGLNHLSEMNPESSPYQEEYRKFYQSLISSLGKTEEKEIQDAIRKSDASEISSFFTSKMTPLDRTVLGMIKEISFKDQPMDYKKFTFGGMKSMEEYQSGISLSGKTTAKEIFEGYLAENPKEGNPEKLRENLENAVMNASSLLSQEARKTRAKPVDSASLQIGILAPGYQKLKEEQEKQNFFTQNFSTEGKENKRVLNMVRETFEKYTDKTPKDLEKELLTRNDTMDEMMNHLTKTIQSTKKIENYIGKMDNITKGGEKTADEVERFRMSVDHYIQEKQFEDERIAPDLNKEKVSIDLEENLAEETEEFEISKPTEEVLPENENYRM